MLPETAQASELLWVAACMWGVANHTYMYRQVGRILSEAGAEGITISPEGCAILLRDQGSEFDRAVGKALFGCAGIVALFRPGAPQPLLGWLAILFLFAGLLYLDITSVYRWSQRRRVLAGEAPL